MDWAKKYKESKEQKALKYDDGESSEKLFDDYKNSLIILYKKFQDAVKESGISIRYQKTKISKDKKASPMGETAEIDVLILADNENELHIIPEGIGFIGIKGRVGLKCFRKVYAFQSITERRIKFLREPSFVLIDDKDENSNSTWGFIAIQESAGNRLIIKLSDDSIEKILDDVFLS